MPVDLGQGVSSAPLIPPIVKVLRALHGPDLRRDVRDDSELPHVQQDAKLPRDQEVGDTPLATPVVRVLRALPYMGQS